MPRSRVRPEDRKRSATACIPCRASKRRCDSHQPCRTCVRKYLGGSCVYAPLRQELPSANGRPTLLASVASQIPPWGEPTRSSVQHQSPFASRPSEMLLAPPDEQLQSTRDTIPSGGQRPVMMYSSTGERFFLGNEATISFMRFLQEILKRSIGTNNFSENQGGRLMFEAEILDPGKADFDDVLQESEKRVYIQCFLGASSGFLDLFTQTEMEHLLAFCRQFKSPGPNPIGDIERQRISCLCLMIAIGAQCRGRDEQDLQYAAKYFCRARKLAFQDMFEAPTVDMARSFILMAFYMLGACRRNSALMYIGVASKACVILGLHTSATSSSICRAEAEARLRTGKSIRVLDMVCSTILGRQESTPLIQDGAKIGSPDHDISHRSTALGALYGVTSVLGTIVKELASKPSLDVSSAENFLQALREWSHGLPQALRQEPSEEPETRVDPKYKEIMIGNIHVACMYYFAVILVTRQFLIMHVVPRIDGKRPYRMASYREIDRSRIDEKIAELSDVCSGAAVYMTQICRDAADSGILLANMCILKAWIFAAGLVLGFSLLSENQASLEHCTAFHGSRHVLCLLGRVSPQADQYYRILGSFSEAIDLYKQQVLRRRREYGIPYVEKLLSIRPESGRKSDWPNITSPPPSTSSEGLRPDDGESDGQDYMTLSLDLANEQQASDWLQLTNNADPLLRLFLDENTGIPGFLLAERTE